MRKPTAQDHPLGGAPAFYEFNCTAFELDVDTDTGEILIHKHVSVGDVGKALNPLQVEAQDEGAAIMGLGHSLMEHIVLDGEGRIANLGALDYRILTTMDVPLQLKVLSVENRDGPGPYGSKGVGEGALLCTAPALAAAVTQATGVFIRDLPLTPERVARSTATGCAECHRQAQLNYGVFSSPAFGQMVRNALPTSRDNSITATECLYRGMTPRAACHYSIMPADRTYSANR
jgi:xanthine dehydrogenase molybdopterin-binding subunit B